MAESEEFTSIEQKAPKHRGSQLLVIAGLLVVIFGAASSINGQWWGLVVLGGGLASLTALMLWALKNWEWDR